MSVASSQQLGFEFTAVPACSVRVFSGHYWSIGKIFSSPTGRQPAYLAPGNFIDIVEKDHESAEFRLYTNKAAFETAPKDPILVVLMTLRAGVLAGRAADASYGFRVCNGWDQFNRERVVVEEFGASLGEEGNGGDDTQGGGSTDPGGGGHPK